MDPLPQLTLGALFARDFRVVRPLSAGGMGAVYVVEQMSTGRLRALKIMLPGLVQDPRSRERFTQEASVGGRIRSDHVVEVVAAGVDDATGTPWLAMELLEGEDLQSVMNRAGPLSMADTAEVFRQLCHGLGAAHRTGLVHRDLKPENIFLCAPRREGVPFLVKILDFGIAKVVGESRTSAMATSSVGSPLWMSPEQAEKGAIRPASDVWALGLIAFYLLTGKFYWRAANLPDVALPSILKELFVDALSPPTQRAAEYGCAALLPPGFDPWFAGCTVRDPGARYRDADDALSAFAEVLRAATTLHGFAPASRLVIAAPARPELPPHTLPSGPAAPMGGQVTPAGASGGSPWATHPSSFGPSAAPPSPVPSTQFPGTVGWQPPPGFPLQHPVVAPSGSSVALAVVGGFLVLSLAVVGLAVAMYSRNAVSPPVPRSADGGPVVIVPGSGLPVCAGRMCRVDIAGLSNVRQVSAGRFHTCALLTDGTVQCWGWNATRQLGDGTTEDHYTPTPVRGLTEVVQIAAGDTYTCALIQDGTVRCWGLTNMPHNLPIQVEGIEAMTSIAAGVGHACGRRADGTAWCWGRNPQGELGDGTSSSRTRAVQVAGLNGVAQVAPGGDFSCALVSDGTVWCWGGNDEGQVGNGHHDRELHPSPSMVQGLSGAVRVAAGEQHACALLRTGAMQCWGWNMQGQLGYGAEGGNRPVATTVPGLNEVMDIALGYHHSCARRGDGTAWCWGENSMCELGGGHMTGQDTPERVLAIEDAAELSGGGMHTCVRRTNGTVRCWGWNFYGQLGNGTTSQRPDLQ